MNTVLRPVGPQPARVYWVRRLVLLAVLVAVVLLAWSLVARGAGSDGGSGQGADGAAPASGEDAAGDDGDAADEGAAADEGDAAGEGDGAGDGAPGACSPEALTVTLTADATSYSGSDSPTFTVAFTNTGDEACVVDAGAPHQSLLITSGNDRIWSSADCAVEGGTRTLLLAPGAQDEDTVVWPRVRSDEECTEGLPAPRPGTYTAVAVVGGAQSGTAVFQLG